MFYTNKKKHNTTKAIAKLVKRKVIINIKKKMRLKLCTYTYISLG
jgi:hypothetical protein